MNWVAYSIPSPKQNVAASTQNQALCAILFLYKEVLKTRRVNVQRVKQDLGDFGDVVWAKKAKRLPVVFTREELKAVLDQLRGAKWIMANLLYGV